LERDREKWKHAKEVLKTRAMVHQSYANELRRRRPADDSSKRKFVTEPSEFDTDVRKGRSQKEKRSNSSKKRTLEKPKGPWDHVKSRVH